MDILSIKKILINISSNFTFRNVKLFDILTCARARYLDIVIRHLPSPLAKPGKTPFRDWSSSLGASVAAPFSFEPEFLNF
jgi:hypothetical protein